MPQVGSGAALEKILGGGGLSGLELQSKKCELLCYKPKLFLLFSNGVLKMFFRCRSSIVKPPNDQRPGKAIRGLGLLQKNFLTSPSLERQKMPFCVIGRHAYVIDLHSATESMTPTSNLFCMNMGDTALIFKAEILS